MELNILYWIIPPICIIITSYCIVQIILFTGESFKYGISLSPILPLFYFIMGIIAWSIGMWVTNRKLELG